jgi:DNA polymerase III epsilon subunit-like protein
MNKIHFPNNYIVWDLETSGLSGAKDKILEIGMFKVENGEVVEEKRWVLDNKIDIPEEITRINGMTSSIIKMEGRDPKECLEEFLEYVRDSKANLTHNGIKFDIGFLVEQTMQILNWELGRVEKLKNHLEGTAIDTAVIYKGAKICKLERMWNETFYQYGRRVMDTIIPGKYNLGWCCDELGVDRSNVVQHRALGDVFLTHEVFKKILVAA